MNNFHLRALALLLIVTGLGIFIYKAFVLHFPLTSNSESDVWLVEAKLEFHARGRSTKANLFLPLSRERFLVSDEGFVSGEFGFSGQEIAGNRVANWAIRRATGPQRLYYRAVVRPRSDPSSFYAPKAKTPKAELSTLEGAELAAAKAVVSKIQNASADTESFVRNLIEYIRDNRKDENINLLLGRSPNTERSVRVLLQMLRIANIPVRVLSGIRLGEQTPIAPIEKRIEVYVEGSWRSYDTNTGSTEVPDDFFPWWIGELPLASVTGADRLISTLSVERIQEGAVLSALQKSKYSHPTLTKLSLFQLPIETQSVYRIILLIPLGAFIAVLLRNIVGIKTFGTFMPVLISLAFRETELVWGILFFSFMLGTGLLVRFYLEQLKLLLVPRLAALLTIVVLLMAALSLITHKLGIDRGLSVALFPMVIITMTIERMSIVWEELGGWKSVKQGVGTLLVAGIIYLIIFHPALEHLVFVFPELLLVLLAILLLLGRYTGYRLLELTRFKEFAQTLPAVAHKKES